MRGMLVLLVGLAVTAESGCHSGGPPPSAPSVSSGLRFDRDTRKEMVEAAIPAGTPVEDAVRVLEGAGCECREHDRDGRTCWWCTHSRKEGLLVEMVWQVWVYHDGAAVTSVESEQVGVGL